MPTASHAADAAPGELLIRFDPDVSRSEGAAVAQQLDSQVTERLPLVSNLALVGLPAGLTVREADRLFSDRPEVRYAEPNHVYRVDSDPDDDFFGQLWGLENTGQEPFNGTPDADIDASQAWDVTTGDPAVKVAVVDSGVTVTHPDLTGNVVPADQQDFVEEDLTPDDENSHGTHVAGTLGAVGNNATGVTGVSQQVGLMALKAGGASGGLLTSDIVQAIAYANANGARVLNGSFSGSGSSTSFTNAIAAAPNILFVVAAGNGGTDGVGDDNDTQPQVPCNVELPNVLCVAATGQTDLLASFSNFGRTTVDLAAPGTSTYSTLPQFKVPAEFSDDFSANDFATKWDVGGVNGTWASSSSRLVDSPSGNYLPGANHFAEIENPIDLTGEVDCRVRMTITHDLGTGDFVALEASDLAAPVPTWTAIGLWTGTGSESAIRGLEGFEGSASVGLRVRLAGNGDASVGPGAAIDNFVAECLDPAGEAYGYKSGTSMATPHVAGTAALLLADDPSLSTAQLRNTLLASVDPIPALNCKVFSGGRLNAAAALALSPVNAAPPSSCGAQVTPVVVNPPVPVPETPVTKVKCKKPKKGASARAKAKAKKKCKKLKRKAAAS